MNAVDREKRVRTFVEEVWNKKNDEAADQLDASTSTNGFGTGPAARGGPIRRYHEAFPDLRIEVEETASISTCCWWITGTRASTFPRAVTSNRTSIRSSRLAGWWT